MSESMQSVKFLRLNKNDNTAVVFSATNKIPAGHKIALSDIKKGEFVVKYGFPIGTAVCDIKKGEHIHIHNLKSAISIENDYVYTPETAMPIERETGDFMGFLRSGGEAGIRNEIWIVCTVGCVNKAAEKIAAIANNLFQGEVDGVFAVTHPYGCSQLGSDHENTRDILAGMVNHPNAAGALVLGLGCENNIIDEFKKNLGDYDENRVKFLSVQECENETETALELIEKIVNITRHCKRVKVSLDKLKIGLKCGGSDAFSGLTSNLLAGRISDRICGYGGTALLTETPEMFGAETILMNRCKNEKVFNKTVNIINNFKHYFISNGQNVYENPSPGNKAGGITTLEEKSLGCVQKGGTGTVTDVLSYGERVNKNGLILLDGPGNDIVSASALTAAGCQLILFTTGRGTPLGAFAPTIKISSNSELAKRKKNWIDYDAGLLLNGKSVDEATNEMWDLIISVIEGRTLTKSEMNGCREFAIFKNGVTL